MEAFSIIFNPGILFFLLGLGAALIRSNLSIPDPVVKFVSLYLMLSIGFKGGKSLYHSSLWGDGIIIIGVVLFMSALVPLYAFFLFRKSMGTADAAAIGATYGSNSTLTYITAAGFLTSAGIAFEGYMTVALVVMETPAILLAILLTRLTQRDQPQAKKLGPILRETFSDGTIVVLLGSMAIGYILTATGTDKSPLSAFISGDMFTGMLIFFLLYMGTMVGHKFRQLKGFPLSLIAFAILAPLVNATIALGISHFFGFKPGDTLLLVVLCASASYIVAPAILKEAIPEANPARFLTMSIGITFPLNIVIGIPAFWWIIQRLAET
jgi:hypothetical protein